MATTHYTASREQASAIVAVLRRAKIDGAAVAELSVDARRLAVAVAGCDRVSDATWRMVESIMAGDDVGETDIVTNADDDRPTSVVVHIPQVDEIHRATAGLEVLTQTWPSGKVSADVRAWEFSAVWTPVQMVGGTVERRP